MKTVAVLFNPSAGQGRSIKEKKAIEYHLVSNGIDYDMFISKSETHLKELASEHVNNYPIVVGVGGDTTFNIVASAVLNACPSPMLGLIGTGSANDIVRGLNIQSIKTSCRAIAQEQVRYMDVGVARLFRNDGSSCRISFLGTLSAGLGTTVNRYVARYQQLHPRWARLNPFSQLTAGLKGIRHSFKSGYLPLTATIGYSDTELEKSIQQEIRFSLLVFLNTPYYANGMKMIHERTGERLFDELLDCCIIDTTSFTSTLAVGLNVNNGKYLQRENVSMIHSPAFRVKCPEPLNIQVDGDIYTGIHEFHVSLVPGMLKVLA